MKQPSRRAPRRRPFRRSAKEAATWLIRQGTDIQGPFPEARLAAWRQSGRLPDATEVSSDRSSWSPAGEVTFHAGRRSRARTAGWAFHALLKQHTPVPFVTYALLGVNVGAFLLTAALGAGFFEADWLRLRALGAGYGPDTTGGQWWRLLTATFLHAGIGHLLGNMLFFFFIGRFMERLLGHTPFLVLYLGSALTGSLASLLWSPGRLTVGASGAVFGLFAGILGFLVRRDRDRLAQGILRDTLLVETIDIGLAHGDRLIAMHLAHDLLVLVQLHATPLAG